MRTAETEKQKKRDSDRDHIMRQLAGWLLGCAALLLIALPVRAEEFKVMPVSGSGTITTETLNVRSGPGKEYDAIELVKAGEVVAITGQAENGWYQIELDGKTGYVSDKYVELKGDLAAADGADGSGDDGQTEKEAGEPEEGWAFYQNPRFIKVAVIVAIIFVVFVMLVTTFRGIRGDRDPDDEDEEDEDEDFDGDLEEDDDEYDNDEDDADDDDEYDEDDDPGEEYKDDDADEEYNDDSGEEDDDDRKPVRKKSGKSKTVVIREEDYQLHIDPKYFENTTQIEQPDMVTGYLERQKLEAELEAANAEGRQKELEQAMRKLNELQAEIERLKKNQ